MALQLQLHHQGNQQKQTDQENVILKIRDTPRTGLTCHGTNVCWKLEKDMPTTSTCARYGLSVKVNKYGTMFTKQDCHGFDFTCLSVKSYLLHCIV